MAPAPRDSGGSKLVTEAALRQADLGLHAPTPGSLDRAFAVTLGVGMLFAWIIGDIAPARASVTWAMLLSLVVWQPLVEELLFRGVIQGILLGTTAGAASRWGLSAANVATSLLFVLVHFVNQPFIWAIGVFVPSLLFGLFRERTGSVWPAVVMHALFNAAFFAPS